MISRFIAGLTSPSKIIQYKDDKWYQPVLLIGLMILIALVPIIFYSLNTEMLSYQTQKDIRTTFIHQEVIEYKIEDNTLVYLKNETNFTKVTTEYGNFIFTNSDINNEHLSSGITYAFLKEDVSVYLNNILMMSYKYSELPNFNGLDFRCAKDDDYIFWDKVFNDVSMVLSSFSDAFVTFSIVSNVIILIGDVLICALLIALLIKFQAREGFSKAFKMALYACVPTFMGMVLSLLYNASIFNTLGMLWTFVFGYRISFLIRFKGGL